jgi:hypothetical protein
MAPGMLVELRDRWPHQVRLLAWGKASDGWWGLVVWEQRLRLADGTERVLYAAWVPAGQLSKPHWVAARPLRRHELPEDRTDCPQPRTREWEGYYIGAWPSGNPPAPTDSVKVIKPARGRDSDTYSA